MCSDAVTDLKIEAVDKLIAIGQAEVKKLRLLKRGINLHARLCAAQTDTPDNVVEIARLQRNEAHNRLDDANLDLDIARHQAELREIFDGIMAEMLTSTPGDLLGTLLGSLFGGLDDTKAGFGSHFGDESSEDLPFGFRRISVDDLGSLFGAPTGARFAGFGDGSMFDGFPSR